MRNRLTLSPSHSPVKNARRPSRLRRHWGQTRRTKPLVPVWAASIFSYSARRVALEVQEMTVLSCGRAEVSVGKVTEPYLPEHRHAELVREARWHLVGYALVAAGSLYLQSWAAVLLKCFAISRMSPNCTGSRMSTLCALAS